MRVRLVDAAPWVIVAGLVAAGWFATLPVGPRGAEARVTEFSASRVMERVGDRGAVPARRGIVALWVLLALVTAAALPGFSYLFVWPAIAVVPNRVRRGGSG